MNEVRKLITWEVISVRTETLVGGEAVRTESRRGRHEDRDSRRPWWVCIVLLSENTRSDRGGAFRTERETSSVVGLEPSCDGTKEALSLVMGFDRWRRRRRRRRRHEERENRRLRDGFRSLLRHGEEEKTKTKARRRISMEDRCGGSVWKIGGGFGSIVGFDFLWTENTRRQEVRGEKKEQKK
ncbi:hypothetical protein HID58_064129 [Brassica napus]|uniref:Uncharacterized protein n=1 Tax=Brassica napus TaxID=3708 RepID=A0ABQ7Z931_BRANA|nr:hypothetical protein HID58_064129 [Brassica napus]